MLYGGLGIATDYHGPLGTWRKEQTITAAAWVGMAAACLSSNSLRLKLGTHLSIGPQNQAAVTCTSPVSAVILFKMLCCAAGLLDNNSTNCQRTACEAIKLDRPSPAWTCSDSATAM